MNKKKVLTVYMDPDLHNRLMNVVYWTPGYSANGIVSELIKEAVKQFEESNGGAYKQRPV